MTLLLELSHDRPWIQTCVRLRADLSELLCVCIAFNSMLLSRRCLSRCCSGGIAHSALEPIGYAVILEF